MVLKQLISSIKKQVQEVDFVIKKSEEKLNDLKIMLNDYYHSLLSIGADTR